LLGGAAGGTSQERIPQKLSRFELPNREAAVFSLSSAGGEGWEEEAFSWRGG